MPTPACCVPTPCEVSEALLSGVSTDLVRAECTALGWPEVRVDEFQSEHGAPLEGIPGATSAIFVPLGRWPGWLPRLSATLRAIGFARGGECPLKTAERLSA